jgi:hypothetical protein
MGKLTLFCIVIRLYVGRKNIDCNLIGTTTEERTVKTISNDYLLVSEKFENTNV